MKTDVAIKPLEHLAREERARLSDFLEAIGQKAPIVGVLPGPEAAGFRPVLLGQMGSLSLMRTVPVSASARTGMLELLSLLKPSRACEAFGEHEGRIWIRRAFAPHTLASGEGLRKSRELGPEKSASVILEGILALHQKGLVHGNVCPGNIGVFGADLVVLDAGLAAQHGASTVGAEADLRKFLIIANELGCRTEKEAYEEIIRDPARSVSLSDLGRVLPEVPLGSVRQTGPALIKGGGKSGRIISSESAQIPRQAAAGDEGQSKKSELAKGQAPRSKAWVYAAAVLLGALLIRFAYERFSGSRTPADPRWESYWSSNQPSLMQEVAQAAIKDVRSDAASIIVRDAIASTEHPLVQTKFLKLAFDPRWEGELSDDDRLMALTLGVGGIAQADTSALKPLQSLHPAMAFSLLASTDLEKNFPGFVEVQPAYLSTLPAPIGGAFEILSGIGVASAADPQARGAAHIFAGDASPKALYAFFSGPGENGADVKKIEILMPLLEKLPKLADTVAEAVARSGSPVGKRLAWFASTDNVKWSDLGSFVQLSLASGRMPRTRFEVDALSDLLSFPLDAIRLSAAAKLSEQVPKDAGEVVRFLASSGHSFSRSQAATLVSILTIGGDKASSYIAAWFDTKPDPLGVLALLAVRKGVRGDDILNLESARYLKDAKWSAPLDVLKGLVDHPEPLLRAIIYSKLDPRRKEDRELLEAMEKVDPSERMREVIRQRLKSFGG